MFHVKTLVDILSHNNNNNKYVHINSIVLVKAHCKK